MTWQNRIPEDVLNRWERIELAARSSTDIDGLPSDVGFDDLTIAVFRVAQAKGLVRLNGDGTPDQNINVTPRGSNVLPLLLSLGQGNVEGWPRIVRAVAEAEADPDPDATFKELDAKKETMKPAYVTTRLPPDVASWLARQVRRFQREYHADRATRSLFAPDGRAVGVAWWKNGGRPPSGFNYMSPARWGPDAENPDGVYVPLGIFAEVLMTVGVDIGAFMVAQASVGDEDGAMIAPRPLELEAYQILERFQTGGATIADALRVCDRFSTRDAPMVN